MKNLETCLLESIGELSPHAPAKEKYLQHIGTSSNGTSIDGERMFILTLETNDTSDVVNNTLELFFHQAVVVKLHIEDVPTHVVTNITRDITDFEEIGKSFKEGYLLYVEKK